MNAKYRQKGLADTRSSNRHAQKKHEELTVRCRQSGSLLRHYTLKHSRLLLRLVDIDRVVGVL
jgi:hypothetical protein